MAKIKRASFSAGLAAACLCALLSACGGGCSESTSSRSAETIRSPSDATSVPASDARFSFPSGIAADTSGNVYVTDTGNYSIRMVSADGRVDTLAGTAGEKGTKDGTGVEARFDHPIGITADKNGNLFVLDANAIRKITPEGKVTTFAGAGAEAGYADRIGTAALFNQPEGIAAGTDGNLYVADTGNRVIRRITPLGEVSTVTKLDQEPIHSIAVIGNRLYVGGENCMWRIDLSSMGGIVLARMGGEIGVYDNVDGATGIRFWPLTGITVDRAGNVYAVESFSRPQQLAPVGAIRKMTPSANGLEFTASTVAGNPALSGSADGTGSTALFNLPIGIAAGPEGELYVTDSRNHTIRKVIPDGVVTTIAGKAGEPGSK